MMRKFYFFVMVILVTVGLAVPVFAGQIDALDSEEPTKESSAAYIPLFTSEEEAALGGIVTFYPLQPIYSVVEGYDVIKFYIEDPEIGQKYPTLSYCGIGYFIIDKSKSENNWTLFDMEQDTAYTYFNEVEVWKGAYIPLTVGSMRPDDPSTSFIDESKIPVIRKEDFSGMYPNWISFSDIPFLRSADGSLAYASYQVDDADDEDEDEEDEETSSTDHDSDEWHKYDLNLESGNTCTVLVTKSVSYNGKSHVLDTSPVRKNKTNDVSVKVYLNGKLIAPNTYKVQFKNNKNCNGYGGSENTPYIKLKFKSKDKSTKADFKAIEREKFGFEILPLDISEGIISYKSIKNGQLKKGVWTNGDVTINLTPPKGTQGDYTLDDSTIIGRNNFYGEAKFTDIYIDGGDVH